MARSASIAVSAPGKVLLAGGYLVLDRKYTGLVFGLDARIHVHVAPVHSSPGVVLSEIVVRSPQFREAAWEYGYRLSPNGGGVQVTELRADAYQKLKRNVFVETALAYALSYITVKAPGLIPSVNVTILADNDYYSATGTPLEAHSRFTDFGVTLGEANKTGLGSSAALVTAFTGALLQYFLPKDLFNLNDEQGKRQLHNLAQAAHCAAQGKVGSGFDVASAIFGSCVYRRFTPSILTDCGEPGTKGFARTLRDIVDETGDGGIWDTEIQKKAIKVPTRLRLVMCDVTGGSQTPGMVKSVLAWRKEKGKEADDLWDKLQVANEDLAQELTRLSAESERDLVHLRNDLLAIRELIREMSYASSVPIEPPEQTRLLDACSALGGVVGGVVPGAGGFDAIALLIEDKADVLDRLAELLKNQNDHVSDGLSSRVRMLSTREEMEGVRLEEGELYSH